MPLSKSQVYDTHLLNLERKMSVADSTKLIAEKLGKSKRRIEQIVKAESAKNVGQEPKQNTPTSFNPNVSGNDWIEGLHDFVNTTVIKKNTPTFLTKETQSLSEKLPIISDSDDEILEISNDVEAYSGEYSFKTVPIHKVDLPIMASEDYELKAPIVKPQPIHEHSDHKISPKGERWLILPDIHVPLHDVETINAVLKYVSEIKWDGFLGLGDYMDWDWISRFTKENARAVEGRKFLEEYIPANALLDEIQDAVRKNNPNAKMVMLEGNHDWRVENVIDKTPSLQGLIEIEKNLRFDERNIEYWRYWTHRKPYVIGKAYFIHGIYIGNNHAKKTADNFGKCVFYGHTHDRSSHPKTTFDGSSVFCESFGTLSIQEMPYMGKNPSNWSQCFAEFFFRPDGTFNHYVTNIINNRFIAINGKEYEAES